MATHKELDVWKKAIDLSDMIYTITDTFPKSEQYALSPQLRRAVVSIASNIAEGAARNNTKEFIQYIGIARGSLAEVETQLIIAGRRKFVAELYLEKAFSMIEDISKMMYRLQQALKKKL
ncbi:MAG: four helix bundle protein [Hyphomicrobiales bacterium]|nr:four helix bundle protein [Hyphomicrobiales bacterium]